MCLFKLSQKCAKMLICSVWTAFAVTFSVVWILLYSLAFDCVKVVEPEDIYPQPSAHPDPIKCVIFSTMAGLGVAAAYFFLARQNAPEKKPFYAVYGNLFLENPTQS